ncbi:MAG: hypothetical protein AXA67_12855 [Methylothermaceae bacteria B42]|nr:MAG: hypothetical protein AXA67_12855 [Methylothermaceae bacteria B42]HHJ38487.1 CvpA family protein [Methylothermaceae bacterium]
MIWIDHAILGFIAISALIGLLRGFVRETFSLLTWASAVWIGLRYDSALAIQLQSWIEDPSLRLGLAFILLFLTTLAVGKIAGYLLGTLINHGLFRAFNRLGGLLFGFARGVLLIVLMVLFARSSQLVSEPWWHESMFLPWLEDWAVVLARLNSDDYLKLVHQP